MTRGLPVTHVLQKFISSGNTREHGLRTSHLINEGTVLKGNRCGVQRLPRARSLKSMRLQASFA